MSRRAGCGKSARPDLWGAGRATARPTRPGWLDLLTGGCSLALATTGYHTRPPRGRYRRTLIYGELYKSTASRKQVSTGRRHTELRRQRRISAANLLRRTRDPS